MGVGVGVDEENAWLCDGRGARMHAKANGIGEGVRASPSAKVCGKNL